LFSRDGAVGERGRRERTESEKGTYTHGDYRKKPRDARERVSRLRFKD